MQKDFQNLYVDKEEAIKESYFLLRFKKFYIDNRVRIREKQENENINSIIEQFFNKNAKELIERELINSLKLVILTQSKIFDSKDRNPHLSQFYVSLRDFLVNNYFNKEPFFTSALEQAVYSVKEGFWKELYNEAGDDILNSLRQIGYYSNN